MKQDHIVIWMRSILEESGHSTIQDEHFKKTAERWSKFWAHFNQGSIAKEIYKVLGTTFTADPGEFHGILVQKNIPFVGLCAHHLLPMQGHAHIGYIRQAHMVGLSKLTRLAYIVGHDRPSTQEWYTAQMADLLMCHLAPLGAMVVTDLAHGCMQCRGVEAEDTDTVVSEIRGAFRDNHTARTEFYQMLSTSSR